MERQGGGIVLSTAIALLMWVAANSSRAHHRYVVAHGFPA